MRFNGPDDLSPFDVGGLNAYAYCNGDPQNLSDPSGHASPWPLLFAGVFGIVAGVASVIAIVSEGEKRNNWIGVAAVAGVLAVGFGISVGLKKGGNKSRDFMSSSRKEPKLRTGQSVSDDGKNSSGVAVKAQGKGEASEAREIGRGLDTYKFRSSSTRESYLVTLPVDQNSLRSSVLGGIPLLLPEGVRKPVPTMAGNKRRRLSDIPEETSSIRS